MARLRDKTGITPIFALFLVALIGLPFSLMYTVQKQARAESVENARAISELMLQFRRYYNFNVVNRLQQGDHPVTVTDNYKDIKGAIPIPATMSIELADLLTQQVANGPFRFGFVSDHPFKGRNRPALDEFQRQALGAFRANPELKEYWLEDRKSADGLIVRMAIPVKMQAACIQCHNAHPDSQFRFWRVGDVRGVQDVAVRHSVSKDRRQNFMFLGAYLVGFVTLLFLAIHEYRRSNFRLLALNQEQARTREELVHQRQRLLAQMDDLVTKTTLLDKAPFGIAIADPHREDLPIVYVNEAFTRITGYGPEEVMGRNCRLLQGPETDRKSLDEIRQGLRERRYIDVELVNYRRDGTRFHNRLQLFPCVNAEGELVSYVGCTADVTDLKVAQIQREQLAAELQESMKLQSLGLAIAGIAHDLNTPMGIALTASTHLSNTVRRLAASLPADAPGTQGGDSTVKLVGQLEKAATLIDSNLQKAANLVRSFKQTTADATRTEWRKLTLRPFFESLLMSVSPLMNRAQCKVVLDCPAGISLFTEPGSLSQVVTNLLVNASIHAFEGREDREVRLRVDIEGDSVRIVVADNGNGMSQEALSKAFAPFFTTRRAAGGSGLGLFSSRRVVEETLKGRIGLHSESGRGTTFTILLPHKPDRTA